MRKTPLNRVFTLSREPNQYYFHTLSGDIHLCPRDVIRQFHISPRTEMVRIRVRWPAVEDSSAFRFSLQRIFKRDIGWAPFSDGPVTFEALINDTSKALQRMLKLEPDETCVLSVQVLETKFFCSVPEVHAVWNPASTVA